MSATTNSITENRPKANNTPWRGWDLQQAARAFVQAFVKPPSPSEGEGSGVRVYLDFITGPIPLSAWKREESPSPLPPLGGRGGQEDQS